jgi:hypothetical protein
MDRLIVTSSTYRMTSVPEASGEAERIDPANTYLHRMNVRRLEAEAIRDAILTVSGQREQTMYGPSVPVHLTSFMDGRGRPAQSGPLDGDGRRSVYVSVRRNFLDPMFSVFDAPVPFSTMGRRNVSNVPAQALALMDDPFVIGQARLWAERIRSGPALPERARLDLLYVTALARPPSETEVRASLAFLGFSLGRFELAAGEDPSVNRKTGLAARADRGSSLKAGLEQQPAAPAWADLCHILINMKQFIFVD